MNENGTKMSLMKSILSLIIITLSVTAISCSGIEQESEAEVDQAVRQTPDELTEGDLRSAALNGDLQTVNESIEHGISVDDTDELGRTALMFAAFNGHNEVIDLLIANGAEVNLENDEGRTALMFASSGSFPETVLLLLENRADVNRSDSVEEWTPLMFAAAEGNNEVVEILLQHEADLNAKDSDGETATDFAGKNGHSQTVTLLRNSLTQ